MNSYKPVFLEIFCSFLLICTCLSTLAEETYKYEVEQEVSYSNVYNLIIENQAGNIEVEAHDEEKINVKVVKIIICLNEKVAQDFAQGVNLITDKSDDTLLIKATMPEKIPENIDSVNLDYQIKVPRDIALEIQNGDGNVIVEGIYGNQKIEVANGDVELVNIIGKFNVKVNKGTILGSILLNGESQFYTGSGDISIDIWDSVSYPTTVETDNGSITFSLPSDFSAKFKALAPDGTFSCELSASITRRTDTEIIEGTINYGGPLLELSAFNGDININEIKKPEITEEQADEEQKQVAKEPIDENEDEEDILDIIEEIKEQDTEDINFKPILDFNRVQGLVLGGASQISTVRAGGGRIYASLDYGWSNETWNYQLGVEKSWFDIHKISLGSELHKITDTGDVGLLSKGENILSTVLFGEAFYDYFLRSGYKSWLSLKLTPSTKIKVQYNDDEYITLFKETDWSLFNPETPKRSNRRIDEGILRSVMVSYLFDSRDVKEYSKWDEFTPYPVPSQNTKNGWLGDISVEYAGELLNGDFDYTIYRLNITRYNRILERHAFDFRVKSGISTDSLPTQKRFFLGGIGTLRGYELKEFGGDNMLLANLEYSLKLSEYIWSSIFLDSGYTWLDQQELNLDELHTSAGLGIRFSIEDESIIIYLAQPIEENRSPALILRLERMF